MDYGDEEKMYLKMLRRADPERADALCHFAPTRVELQSEIKKDKTWNFLATLEKQRLEKETKRQKAAEAAEVEAAARELAAKAAADKEAKQARRRNRVIQPRTSQKAPLPPPSEEIESTRVGESARVRVQGIHGAAAASSAAAHASAQAYAGIRRAARGDGSLRPRKSDRVEVSPEGILQQLGQEPPRFYGLFAGE